MVKTNQFTGVGKGLSTSQDWSVCEWRLALGHVQGKGLSTTVRTGQLVSGAWPSGMCKARESSTTVATGTGVGSVAASDSLP